jgi:hypothetical protein
VHRWRKNHTVYLYLATKKNIFIGGSFDQTRRPQSLLPAGLGIINNLFEDRFCGAMSQRFFLGAKKRTNLSLPIILGARNRKRKKLARFFSKTFLKGRKRSTGLWQDCQTFYFQTKNPSLGKFRGP